MKHANDTTIKPPTTIEDFETIRTTILGLLDNPFCDQSMHRSLNEKLIQVDAKLQELRG